MSICGGNRSSGGLGEAPRGSGKGCAGRIASSIAACDNHQRTVCATLEWVDWFNNRRLLEPIGNIPPAEAEERYYARLDEPAMAA